MKSQTAISTKKQPIALNDLTTRKNPKGGAPIVTSRSNIKHPSLTAAAGDPGYKK